MGRGKVGGRGEQKRGKINGVAIRLKALQANFNCFQHDGASP
ncbi:unnamed protein product [Brugia pahangi]|uniref:Uncharacterized protein n=1 Tax=Brugia pahangi TaxID=6280 RepID=A0A0N4TWV0_BRUPA|nr:unnamed protein product [Brugia pahangi]